MSTAERLKMTFQEFLEFESRQKEKHMLWDGEVFAMAGGSEAHARLQTAITLKLGSQLKEPCAVFPSDQAIALPEDRYVYADGSFACTPAFNRGPIDTLKNPVVLFEVLSDTSEAFDRGKKFQGYTPIASLRHYVLLSQYEPLIEVFSRDAKGSSWTFQRLGPGQEFMLEPPGVLLNVDALYAGVPLTVRS